MTVEAKKKGGQRETKEKEIRLIVIQTDRRTDREAERDTRTET